LISWAALGLGLVGCTPKLEVIGTGRYVQVGTDVDGYELCAGTIPRLDAHVEHVYELLQETPPSEPIFEIFLSDDVSRWCDRDACAAPAGGRPGQKHHRVYASEAAHTHELAHLIQFEELGEMPALYAEGVATRFASLGGLDGSAWNLGWAGLDQEADGDAELASKLSQPVLESHDYGLALVLANAIVDRHGVETWKTVVRAADPSDEPEATMAHYEDTTGESLYETLSGYLDQPGATTCNQDFLSCSGEVVPWDGDRWEQVVTAPCSDDEVVGQSLGKTPGHARTRKTLEIEAGMYAIPALDDPDLIVHLDACGRCDLTIDFFPGPQEVWLEAGMYELVSEFDVDAVGSDSRTIEIKRLP
jgi:hypothetical protein